MGMMGDFGVREIYSQGIKVTWRLKLTYFSSFKVRIGVLKNLARFIKVCFVFC